MFQIGTLVRTRMGQIRPFSDDPYVQCFPGTISKDDWRKEPERIFICETFICETIDEGLVGQIVDIVEVGPVQSERFYYLLVKIITVIDSHPRIFWVFAEEIELLEE